MENSRKQKITLKHPLAYCRLDPGRQKILRPCAAPPPHPRCRPTHLTSTAGAFNQPSQCISFNGTDRHRAWIGTEKHLLGHSLVLANGSQAASFAPSDWPTAAGAGGSTHQRDHTHQLAKGHTAGLRGKRPCKPHLSPCDSQAQTRSPVAPCSACSYYRLGLVLVL